MFRVRQRCCCSSSSIKEEEEAQVDAKQGYPVPLQVSPKAGHPGAGGAKGEAPMPAGGPLPNPGLWTRGTRSTRAARTASWRRALGASPLVSGSSANRPRRTPGRCPGPPCGTSPAGRRGRSAAPLPLDANRTSCGSASGASSRRSRRTLATVGSRGRVSAPSTPAKE